MHSRCHRQFAGLLLHVFGYARGLVDRPALLGPLTTANLAHFLLARSELGDIGVVALLHVLVGALHDRLLLQAGHSLLLLGAAEAGHWVVLAAAEVDPAADLLHQPVLVGPRRGMGGANGGQEAEGEH